MREIGVLGIVEMGLKMVRCRINDFGGLLVRIEEDGIIGVKSGFGR